MRQTHPVSWRKRSETTPNLLMLLQSNFAKFSERALIPQVKQSDLQTVA
jgi:hypothetical protein